MSTQAMRAADAAWLHMDRPTNPMVVNGLILLRGVPDVEVATELLKERLVDRFPRFRQRVTERVGRTPAFEDDPTFDIDNHLHYLALPAPWNTGALRAMLSDLVTPPLDPGKPLWHAYLIEGGEAGTAILWRIHHCIADGIALARVLLSTTDEGGPADDLSPPPPENGRGALERLVDLPRSTAGAVRGAGAAVVHEGIESIAHPDHLRALAETALRDVGTAAKLVASPPDPASDLRVPLTGARRVAWSEPFPLDRVKDAGRRLRVTVNDLLLTALAGGVHELLGSDGRLPDEIHAMVPFNLRPLDQPVPEDLGNDFALVLLSLPVGDLRPAERLREVNSRMDAIKNSHEAPISYGIISTIGLTPPWVEDPLIGFFSEKASLVVTNVPGPRERIHFGGAPIDGVLVWAPCSGSLGMTVSIFSYRGEVTIGFMADTALIDDPEPLARACERQLEELCGSHDAG